MPPTHTVSNMRHSMSLRIQLKCMYTSSTSPSCRLVARPRGGSAGFRQTLHCLMRFATRCNTHLNFHHKCSPYIISAFMLARCPRVVLLGFRRPMDTRCMYHCRQCIYMLPLPMQTRQLTGHAAGGKARCAHINVSEQVSDHVKVYDDDASICRPFRWLTPRVKIYESGSSCRHSAGSARVPLFHMPNPSISIMTYCC
jgi:hypothetical protein